MKNILAVMKKELLRVAKDWRLIVALLMPGLIVYVLYTVMGGAIHDSVTGAAGARYKIIVFNMPQSITTALNTEGLAINADYEYLSGGAQDAADKSELLKRAEADIVVLFDANFDDAVSNNQTPSVTIYYSPSEETSVYAFQKFNAVLEYYRMAVLAQNNALVFNPIVSEVANPNAMLSGLFSTLVPMLIVTFLFSGCMSVAPDAIAGEKERGTIATILITPIKRSHLALGKVFALSVLAIVSALSSFLGLILSLPKLLGTEVDITTVYGFTDYLLLLFVLISTVLLIIGLMTIISSFAKSVREASMLLLPFMIVSMLAGLSPMLSGGAVQNPALYLIPLYNAVHSMTSILAFKVSYVNLIVTVAANTVYLVGAVFALTKLFNSEKIMFGK